MPTVLIRGETVRFGTHAGVVLVETQKHAKLRCPRSRRAVKGPSRSVACAASRPGPSVFLRLHSLTSPPSVS